MQEGSKWAVDETGFLIEIELADVAETKVEIDAGIGGPHLGLLDHRWRRVDADHATLGRKCDRDCDATIADRQLDQHPFGLAGEINVERHVDRHARRPLVVPLREPLVPTHPPSVRTDVMSLNFYDGVPNGGRPSGSVRGSIPDAY